MLLTRSRVVVLSKQLYDAFCEWFLNYGFGKHKYLKYVGNNRICEMHQLWREKTLTFGLLKNL